MTNQGIISLVTAVYMWFNQISDPSAAFQKKDLEKYFTPDFIMDMNDSIATNDYDTLFEHFDKFRQSGYSLKVQYPFKEIFISEDGQKCTVRYSIIKTSPDNKEREIKVIAIWHIAADGRLKRMNEVVYFEGGADKGVINRD